jgi:hypothetical protein
MLNLAYVVTAHKNARQLARLLAAIYDPSNTYVLHVDRKSPLDVHQAARTFATSAGRARVLRPRSIIWGSSALAKTQFEGIAAALELSQDWQYLLNLTGQDYPLRPQSFIRQWLSDQPPGRNYMEVLRFADASPPVQKRMQFYWINWRGQMKKLMQRTPRADPEIFWGSNYFILTREACEYLVRDPAPRKLARHFRWALCSDELFFQTALMHSRFRDTIVRDHKRKIVWAGGWHPKTFTIADKDELLASDAFFARKFDEQLDATIFDAIDQSLLSHQSAHAAR